MNFLAPAGSSVPHPHYQTQVRAVPYSGLARLIALGRDFAARTRRNYWEALIETEKRNGARFIGSTGRVQWLAAYAPAHQREIWGVLPGVAGLLQISDADADAFAEGAAKVISWYESLGNHPFNFAFFSSPDPAAADHFALHVKVCSRPSLRPLYSNYDTWSMPKMFGDDVHTEPPENWAEALRQGCGA